jgi:hypothetical protein
MNASDLGRIERVGNRLGVQIVIPPAVDRKNVLEALRLVYQAESTAEQTDVSPVEFATDRADMLAKNISSSELRWMIQAGLLEHVWEMTAPHDSHRRFESARNLRIDDRSCFLLTSQGFKFLFATSNVTQRSTRAKLPPAKSNQLLFNPTTNELKRIRSDSARKPIMIDSNFDKPSPFKHTAPKNGAAANNGSAAKNGDAAKSNPALTGRASVNPTWCDEKRELTLCGNVVRKYKWPAANQAHVLQAFQKSNWSRQIEDPLPLDSEVDRKRRLHDTIKCLNRHQNKIRFRGDGTGLGILWELVEGSY